ncbi:MAG: sigma-70 family RNA polymerase sigma factor, partial [Steroidobacteraceae bacterium]
MTPSDESSDARGRGRSRSNGRHGELQASRAIAGRGIALERAARLCSRAREQQLIAEADRAAHGQIVRTGAGDSATVPAADTLWVAIRRAVAHPPLTPVQERRLLRAYHRGQTARERLAKKSDTDADLRRELAAQVADLRRELTAEVADGELACETLIRCHLQIVTAIAHAYPTEGLDTADLVQEGITGLMHAIEKFDDAHTVKFVTYAVWWIRQAIQRGIDNQARTIRLPVHVCEVTRQLHLAEERLWHERQHEPTIAALAARLDVDPAHAAFLMQAAQTPVTLDHQGRSRTEPRGPAARLAAPEPSLEEHAIEAQRAHAITDALDRLVAEDREVLCLRFGLDGESEHTLDDLGRAYGVNRERIRQIQTRTIATLARTPSLYKSILDD